MEILCFTGTVSLNNNGGFCSVQHVVKPIILRGEFPLL
jgi:hypothetical protein